MDDDYLKGFYNVAAQYVVEKQKVSISGVQRQLRIGYNLAESLVKIMENSGVVSTPCSVGNREVLISNKELIQYCPIHIEECKKQKRNYENDFLELNGEVKVYQTCYNYGFTDKPKLIIDIHTDIKKFASVRSNENVINVLKNAFLTLDWSRETVVKFYFDSEAETLYLTVDFPEIEDTPVSTDNQLKTPEQYYYDYCRHVHSIAVRLIAVSFLCSSKVQHIIFSGYSQLFNHETGDDEDNYLMNVSIARKDFEKLNIDTVARVDPIRYLAAVGAITNINKNYKMEVIDLKW